MTANVRAFSSLQAPRRPYSKRFADDQTVVPHRDPRLMLLAPLPPLGHDGSPLSRIVILSPYLKKKSRDVLNKLLWDIRGNPEDCSFQLGGFD